eukprot:6383605-Alexandrium_andersonii.AAC.1
MPFFCCLLDLPGGLADFRLAPVIMSRKRNSGSGGGDGPKRKVGALSESSVFGMENPPGKPAGRSDF